MNFLKRQLHPVAPGGASAQSPVFPETHLTPPWQTQTPRRQRNHVQTPPQAPTQAAPSMFRPHWRGFAALNLGLGTSPTHPLGNSFESAYGMDLGLRIGIGRDFNSRWSIRLSAGYNRSTQSYRVNSDATTLSFTDDDFASNNFVVQAQVAYQFASIISFAFGLRGAIGSYEATRTNVDLSSLTLSEESLGSGLAGQAGIPLSLEFKTSGLIAGLFGDVDLNCYRGAQCVFGFYGGLHGTVFFTGY